MSQIKRCAGQCGFALLEVMAFAAVLMLGSGFVYTQNAALWRNYHKEQVRFAAQLLASDLRQLQQEALFPEDTSSRDIRINPEKNGYFWGYNIEQSQRLKTMVLVAVWS